MELVLSAWRGLGDSNSCTQQCHTQCLRQPRLLALPYRRPQFHSQLLPQVVKLITSCSLCSLSITVVSSGAFIYIPVAVVTRASNEAKPYNSFSMLHTSCSFFGEKQTTGRRQGVARIRLQALIFAACGWSGAVEVVSYFEGFGAVFFSSNCSTLVCMPCHSCALLSHTIISRILQWWLTCNKIWCVSYKIMHGMWSVRCVSIWQPVVCPEWACGYVCMYAVYIVLMV